MNHGQKSTASARLIRFDGKQIPEHSPLRRRKLVLKTSRVQNGQPLFRRNAAQVLKGATHLALTVSRHLVEGLGRPAYSSFLLGAQMLEHLVPLQDALALLWRLAVQGLQPVHQPLLLILRQTVEAWLPAQSIFLLLRCQVLVIIQPLRQMPLLPRTILRLPVIARRCALPGLRMKLLLRYRLRPWLLLVDLRSRTRRSGMRTVLSGKNRVWEDA